MAQYLTQKHSLTEYKDEIHRYRNLARKISDEAAPWFRSGMITVQCSEVNQYLAAKADEQAVYILNKIVSDNRERNSEIAEKFRQIGAKMHKLPQNTEELVAFAKFVEEAKSVSVPAPLNQLAQSRAEVNFLMDEEFLIDHDFFKTMNHAVVCAKVGWIEDLSGAKAILASHRERFEQD